MFLPSEKEWSVEAELSYGGESAEITVGASHTQTQSSEKSSFQKASSAETRYFGGDSNLGTQEGKDNWQPTVARSPWLMSGDLVLISDLIEDQEKREAMATAALQYVMEPYLANLEQQFTWANERLAEQEIKYSLSPMYANYIAYKKQSFEQVCREVLDIISAKYPLVEDELLAFGDYLADQIISIKAIDTCKYVYSY